MSQKQSNYDKYVTGWAGKRVLEQHSLDHSGTWRIFGEDPNCDMGGTHIQPDLGMVEGKLRDVIEYAVELPGFFAWGGGGDIRLLGSPKKINPSANKRRKELQAQLAVLEAEMASVKEKLKEL